MKHSVLKDENFKLMKHMITWKNVNEKLPGKMNVTVFFKMNTYLVSNTNMLKICKM